MGFEQKIYTLKSKIKLNIKLQLSWNILSSFGSLHEISLINKLKIMLRSVRRNSKVL